MTRMTLSCKRWRTGYATRPNPTGPRSAAVPMNLKPLTGERAAFMVRKRPDTSTETLANVWPEGK